uniref:Uncharacterized protein n=1 Tax=Arundo donax TaxID=35708 RepID=A0A0A9CYX0_ARUDO
MQCIFCTAILRITNNHRIPRHVISGCHPLKHLCTISDGTRLQVHVYKRVPNKYIRLRPKIKAETFFQDMHMSLLTKLKISEIPTCVKNISVSVVCWPN